MAGRPAKAEGMQWVNSYLMVKDMKSALEFYEKVFGFEIRMTMPDKDGTLMHAEMQHKVPPRGDYDYRIQALDLGTGKVVRQWPTKEIFNVGHHHRCYRNRISQRYLTTSRRGVEFVDLETGENSVNHWARSGCLLGNFPCNGLLYLMPHHCRCYIEAKLTGFNALASSPDHSTAPAQITVNESGRLKIGPARAGNGP